VVPAPNRIEPEPPASRQFGSRAPIEDQHRAVDGWIAVVQQAVPVDVPRHPPSERPERDQPEDQPARLAAPQFDLDLRDLGGIEVHGKRRDVDADLQGPDRDVEERELPGP
jgi:hypothetical protein